MESNNYCEVLVKVQATKMERLLAKLLWIMMAVYFVVGVIWNVLFLLLGVVFLVLALVWKRRLALEYEYQYLDGTLQVDKIIDMKKRKKCGRYDVENLCVMAPEGDEHLTPYLNRKDARMVDYTSRSQNGESRYVAVYRGKGEHCCATLEPTDKLVQLMWRSAPGKVIRKRKEY